AALLLFFFSSRRRHTRSKRDWSSDVCSSDLLRTRNNVGLPIEVLDSMRLLARSRYAYLDAIIDFNRAQFELYVSLGQPPADFLEIGRASCRERGARSDGEAVA